MKYACRGSVMNAKNQRQTHPGYAYLRNYTLVGEAVGQVPGKCLVFGEEPVLRENSKPFDVEYLVGGKWKWASTTDRQFPPKALVIQRQEVTLVEFALVRS